MLRLQARRIAASAEELSNIQVIVKQLQESRSKLNGLLEKKNELFIRAPISGTIYDLEESLHPGRWINKKLPIVTIADPARVSFDGVVSESELSRIRLMASAKFIPDNPELEAVWGYVGEIENANLQMLDMDELASIYGGQVPVQLDQSQKLVPDKSIYRVRFDMSLVEDVQAEQEIRGVVHVEGAPESYIQRVYKLIVSVFVRESGF